MNDRLDQLRHELAEPVPHPDDAEVAHMGQAALAWIMNHFATLPEQPIGRTATAPEMKALLDEPLPETGQDFDAVLAEFREKVAPFAFRVNHPRFLAFIPSAPSFPSIAGDLLCSGANFFAGVWLEAAGPAQVERIVLDWFAQIVGYPPEAQGILTGGGSEANLTALVVARESLSFEERTRAMLYVTEQRHASVDRAAKVIGLRPDQIQPVPASAKFTMEPEALKLVVSRDRHAGRLPWALAANAGATNTGAVDTLEKLGALCQRERL